VKKVLLILPLFLLLAVSTFAQAPQKIGYVDSQVMLSTLPEAIKAQGELDKIAKSWYAYADTLTAKLQTEYADYQKNQSKLAPEKLKDAQQSIVTKEQELNLYKQQKFGQNGELYKKQEELFAPVKEKIMKGIQDVAKEESMNFIFDKSGDILLLYADSAFDITYKVLDRLKRGK